jgi:hypothetical protein
VLERDNLYAMAMLGAHVFAVAAALAKKAR